MHQYNGTQKSNFLTNKANVYVKLISNLKMENRSYTMKVYWVKHKKKISKLFGKTVKQGNCQLKVNFKI